MNGPESRSDPDAIADAILAGRPVDWGSARSESDPGDARIIDELKALNEIAAAYRRLPIDGFEPKPTAEFRGDEGPVATFGSLRLLARIGTGAFGDVFRAWDTRLEREVALKLLRIGPPPQDTAATMNTVGDPAAVLAEARRLARVHHPNVVTIHGADHHDGQVGLWMELVDGVTLDALVRQRGRLSLDEVIAIGADLAHAVAAVHDQRLIHADITPKNVMRDHTGRVVLMDFGAGHEEDVQGNWRCTAGTPVCMAPELLAGAPVSVRSDLYSLGVVLFLLATGTFPVMGRSVDEIREAHRRNSGVNMSARLRESAPGLFSLIERLLSADPALRPESARVVHAALIALNGSSDASAVTTGRGGHIGWQSRAGVLALMLVTSLLTAGGVGALWHAEPSAVNRAGGEPATTPTQAQAAVPTPALGAGHLLFPVGSLNALQELDPATNTIVQTIRLPEGYIFSRMLISVLVRQVDHSIIVNARDRSGRPALLVLSPRGELIDAQTVPNKFPGPAQFLQQIQFDPADPTQGQILAGIPFAPRVVALNPLTDSVEPRIDIKDANFIGLHADRLGRLYVGNWSSGQIVRFTVGPGQLTGALKQESVFANLAADAGHSASNAIAVADDAVYVAQCDTQRVFKYVEGPSDRPTTGTLSRILKDPDFTYPCTVSVDPTTGRLYVGNEDTDRVVIFEPDGARFATIAFGGRYVGVAGVVPR